LRPAKAPEKSTATREASALFNKLDLDGDGVVTQQELSQATGLGGAEVAKLMREMDKDGDGVITRQELGDVAARPVPSLLAPAVYAPYVAGTVTNLTPAGVHLATHVVTTVPSIGESLLQMPSSASPVSQSWSVPVVSPVLRSAMPAAPLPGVAAYSSGYGFGTCCVVQSGPSSPVQSQAARAKLEGPSVAQAEAVFKALDADGDGVVSFEELSDQVGSAQAAVLFNQLDSNGDGVISKEEIVREVAACGSQAFPEAADAEEGALFARVRSALARVFGREAAGALEDPSAVLVPAGWAQPEPSRLAPEPASLPELHVQSVASSPTTLHLEGASPSAALPSAELRQAASKWQFPSEGDYLQVTRPSSPSPGGLPGQADSLSSTAAPASSSIDVVTSAVMGSLAKAPEPVKEPMRASAWEVVASAAAETKRREAERQKEDLLFGKFDGSGRVLPLNQFLAEPKVTLPAKAVPSRQVPAKPKAVDVDLRSSKQARPARSPVSRSPSPMSVPRRSPSPMGSQATKVSGKAPERAKDKSRVGSSVGSVLSAARDRPPSEKSPVSRSPQRQVPTSRSQPSAKTLPQGKPGDAPFSQSKLRSFLRNLSRSPSRSPQSPQRLQPSWNK